VKPNKKGEWMWYPTNEKTDRNEESIAGGIPIPNWYQNTKIQNSFIL
jgi:hypothetical protein